MVVKYFVIICASAFFIQSVLSQCMGRFGGYRSGLVDEFGLDGMACSPGWTGRLGCGGVAPAVDITIASSLNAAYGGCLPIKSASATAPTGLAVTSENAYEGPVAVGGNLPFLGTAAMDGVFSTGGAGAINYGCGDGVVAITAEEPLGAAIAPATIPSAAVSPAAINPAMASWGYKGCGCSCSNIY